MIPNPASSIDDAALPYPDGENATVDPFEGADLEAEATTDPKATERGSRLISRLLPAALRLWLHTQLDHLEGLDFRIEGKDRQILSGYVPQVSLAAQQAVYRGLHVSQVAVTATDIRVNLGQVLRGKPLRLLQPFPVRGRVYLSTADVRASLHAPLLEQGLQEIFQRWQQTSIEGSQAGALHHLDALPPASQLTDISLGEGQLTLTWQLSEADDQRLRLQTQLSMRAERWLCLGQTTVQTYRDAIWSEPTPLEEVVMDLGPEANIQQLAVTANAIEMAGEVRVIP